MDNKQFDENLYIKSLDHMQPTVSPATHWLRQSYDYLPLLFCHNIIYIMKDDIFAEK